jgi:hypothetical protein
MRKHALLVLQLHCCGWEENNRKCPLLLQSEMGIYSPAKQGP